MNDGVERGREVRPQAEAGVEGEILHSCKQNKFSNAVSSFIYVMNEHTPSYYYQEYTKFIVISGISKKLNNTLLVFKKAQRM